MLELSSLPSSKPRLVSAVARTQKHAQPGCAKPNYGSKPAPTGRPAAVRMRGPSSVTATVCSKWAESDPSTVEIDHWSSCTTTSAEPDVIIGSTANVIPGASSGPRPGEP